jgi:hypothetical protein
MDYAQSVVDTRMLLVIVGITFEGRRYEVVVTTRALNTATDREPSSQQGTGSRTPG